MAPSPCPTVLHGGHPVIRNCSFIFVYGSQDWHSIHLRYAEEPEHPESPACTRVRVEYQWWAAAGLCCLCLCSSGGQSIVGSDSDFKLQSCVNVALQNADLCVPQMDLMRSQKLDCLRLNASFTSAENTRVTLGACMRTKARCFNIYT